MNVVVCMPEVPGIQFVQGSGLARCADCDTSVMVAPTTLQMIEADPSKEWLFACVVCANKRIQADPNPVLGAIPGQAEELEAFRRDAKGAT